MFDGNITIFKLNEHTNKNNIANIKQKLKFYQSTRCEARFSIKVTSSALDIQHPLTAHTQKTSQITNLLFSNQRNNKQPSPKYSSNSFCIECSRIPSTKSTTDVLIGSSNGKKTGFFPRKMLFFHPNASILDGWWPKNFL